MNVSLGRRRLPDKTPRAGGLNRLTLLQVCWLEGQIRAPTLGSGEDGLLVWARCLVLVLGPFLGELTGGSALLRPANHATSHLPASKPHRTRA